MSGTTLLRSLQLNLLRDKSPSDRTQVAYALAQVDLYRQGATVTTAHTIAAGGSWDAPVFDVGSVLASDTIAVGVGGSSLSVTAVDAEAATVSLHNSTGSPIDLRVGDRLIPATGRPTAYADGAGTISLGSTLYADSSGRVSCYINATPFDYVVSPLAVSYDATSTVTPLTGNGPTLIWNHTVGGPNRVVLVGVSWQESTASESIDSVTYAGKNMTRLGLAALGSGAVELYYLLDAPTGTQAIVITWSGSSAKGAVAGAVSIAGADPDALLGSFQSAAGSGVAPLVTMPATASGSVLLAVVGVNALIGTTLTANQTSRWSGTGGTGGSFTRTQAGGETAAGTGASVGMGWSLGASKPWTAAGAEGRAVVAATRLTINAEGAAYQHSPFGVNVLDYSSFQAAHDALPDSGGTIFVPAGTYSATTVPSFEGLVVSKALNLVGESIGPANALSRLHHNVSGAEHIDAILIQSTAGCALRNLYLLGPGIPGSGRGIRFYKEGIVQKAGLTLENVTVEASANLAFEFICDGYEQNWVSKLEMIQCTAFHAASGGSLFLGGAGTNNNVFERCEFDGPGYGGYCSIGLFTVRTSLNYVETTLPVTSVQEGDEAFGPGLAVGTVVTHVDTSTKRITLSAYPIANVNNSELSFYGFSTHTLAGCTYLEDATAIHAPSVASVSVGDQIAAAGFPAGTVVVSIDSVGNYIHVSDHATSDQPGSSETIRIYDKPTSGKLPRGHAHLARTSISRFHHCSFQGPSSTPALSTILVSNDLALRDSYREVATAADPVHSFVVNNMYNCLIDGLYHKVGEQDSRLLMTGDGMGGVIMGRVTNVQLVTLQSSPGSTNVLELNNSTDQCIVDNTTESSYSGAIRDITVDGDGASLLTIASDTNIALPNGSDEAFFVSGSNPITALAAAHPKRRVTLIFTGTATLTDGTHLKLNGDFSGSANRTITLLCDGANWWEVARVAST